MARLEDLLETDDPDGLGEVLAMEPDPQLQLAHIGELIHDMRTEALDPGFLRKSLKWAAVAGGVGAAILWLPGSGLLAATGPITTALILGASVLSLFRLRKMRRDRQALDVDLVNEGEEELPSQD